MPSFSFILTEKCNWHCPYCYFTGLSWPKEPNLDRFKEHLPYIKKIIDRLGDLVVNIDIQGGEVGLIDSEILRYFF
jgi:MoaA/NifB/PqqE/SkfB family radical SAM enzyme